jgi:2-polyprenyl-3-methyl-5-hydroxy-6-metoxy-1,4-benzoquinol methylase
MEINQKINLVEELINQKDPDSINWNFRVGCVYRLFRILNEPRFKLEPVNIDKITEEINNLIEFIKDTPIVKKNNDNFNVKDEFKNDKSKRMQYMYGMAWSELSKEEYLDASELLFQRINNSNIDMNFLKDANCLDFGVGIGRWSHAMVKYGAKSVLGIDYSQECLDAAEKYLKNTNEKEKITLLNKDIYTISEDMHEKFDFVCSTGVVHHLPDPEGGIKKMAYCTKPGGKAFLFVFSKNNTPWWNTIELMRRVMKDIPIYYSNLILKNYESKGSQIFNILDYSYTPIQYKLEIDWVEKTCKEAGFKNIIRLNGGAIHDSELRSRLFDTDKIIYGISEVRYLLEK